MARQFENRKVAGRELAETLQSYADREDLLILALPRGGVPVGFEVAKALDAPLDVFLVRKLGAPGREELAVGAIASGGVRVLNRDVIRSLGVTEEEIERVAERERRELQRREESYRGARAELRVKGRPVILVDDGLATGATMRAAVEALKEQEPAEIIVAVPTAPPETCAEFEGEVEAVHCLTTPTPFFGVGGAYRDFSQTTDQEVRELLAQAREG